MNYQAHITYNSKILGGKPIIKGTRIPVELILKMLAQNTSHEEILKEYPDLKKEDILAAIAYAEDTIAGEEVYHLEYEVR